MENSMYLKNIVHVDMRNGLQIKGIVIEVGSKWLLLKHIPADFVVDGYVLINTNYVKDIYQIEDLAFHQSILKLKKVSLEPMNIFDLNNTEQIIGDLQIQNKLIGITLKKPHSIFVGNITVVREKSMRVFLIDKNCNKLQEETFLYNELRMIAFENDYVNSLQLYLDSISLHDAQS